MENRNEWLHVVTQAVLLLPIRIDVSATDIWLPIQRKVFGEFIQNTADNVLNKANEWFTRIFTLNTNTVLKECYSNDNLNVIRMDF